MIFFPGSSVSSRRIKDLAVTPETLVYMCQADGTYRLSATGMPADAKVYGVRVDDEKQIIHVVIESESFEEISAGTCIPRLLVTFTKHFDPKPDPEESAV